MATITAPSTIGFNTLKFIRNSLKALQKIKKVDPKERYVLLFPDGDSAYVGMAFKLLTCKPAEQVFEQASEFVKKDLLRLCLDGPKTNLLDSVENKHLATFVTSHATITKLADENPNVIPLCKAAGGIGIGMMNSLVFSGSMSFENALDLVKRQGQAFDHAAKIVPTAKVKVRLFPATSKIRVCRAAIEHCKTLGIPDDIAKCSVTKHSYAHVIEIAGHEEAIRYLETEGLRLFKFRFISRVKRDPHAFHTELMDPVQQFVRMYLEQRMREDVNYLKDPETCSVYSSIASRRLRTAEYIKSDLIAYPVSSIKTEQLLHRMFQRPPKLAQPNVYVLWSKKLRSDLHKVNFRAWKSSKLYF